MRRILTLTALLAAAVLVPAAPGYAAEPPTVRLTEPDRFTQYQTPATIEMTAVAQSPIVVTGTVWVGSFGCRYLNTGATTYLLSGGDPAVLQGGHQVEVTGIPQPTWETICFFSEPILEVISAEPL